LLKKFTDYFFYLALTFFTIVGKKNEIAEISAQNQILTNKKETATKKLIPPTLKKKK